MVETYIINTFSFNHLLSKVEEYKNAKDLWEKIIQCPKNPIQEDEAKMKAFVDKIGEESKFYKNKRRKKCKVNSLKKSMTMRDLLA